MNKIEIDQHTHDRLEAMSLERNESKGSIALALAEKFFGTGGAHPRRGGTPVAAQRKA